jgi:hypothetical protein
LVTHASSTDDLTAVASLPLTNPVNGPIWVAQAEAKALGLLGNSSGVDGYIGFATGNIFNFNHSNGVAGLYDFFGIVAHEISEVMGRFLLVGSPVGSTAHAYSLLDLFHYSSAGHRDFVGTQPGYFSINGGVTNLDNFNTNAGGDFGDWAGSAGNDAFRAFSSSGVVNAVSTIDLRELDILGWNRTTATTTVTVSAGGVTVGATASLSGASLPHDAVLVGYSDPSASYPATALGGYQGIGELPYSSDTIGYPQEDFASVLGHTHLPSDFLFG